MSQHTEAIVFHEIGGPEVLQIACLDMPIPSENEVLIRVEAFALNRADILFMHGQHYTLPDLPSRIGSEAVGEVIAIGDNVEHYQVGDKVCTIPHHTAKYGVQGRHTLMDDAYIVPWPSNLTAIEASALWMQMLTAYFPIVEIAKLCADDYILIGAGSSSAALGAIAIAKEVGAQVIATTRTVEKVSQITAAGADYVIVTDTENLAERVNQISNEQGVRVVFDPIGGAFHTRYLDCLAESAIVFIYGMLSGKAAELDVVKMVRKSAILHPYSMFNHVREPQALYRALRYINERAETGKLVPIVDKVFDYKHCVDAYHYMETEQQIGKIIVTIDRDL